MNFSMDFFFWLSIDSFIYLSNEVDFEIYFMAYFKASLAFS